VFDKDLGTCTGKIINGRTLQYMHIVSKANVLEFDLKESDVLSDLMVDFSPISKEDNLEVLAAFVVSHFKDTGDIINYNSISPTIGGAPLKVASKRKSKKKFDDEENAEVKPKKQKKAPKVKVSEPTLPDIQEEVAELGHVEVLNKRTKGGSSEASSQPKLKVQKKAKKHVRNIIQSKYTEEKDAQVEEASTLVTRMDRRKQVVADTSSDPQTDTQYVDVDSLQVQESPQSQEAFIIEPANSVAKELRTSVARLVEKKTAEDAQKVLEFTEPIQISPVAKVDEMLKATMQVKR